MTSCKTNLLQETRVSYEGRKATDQLAGWPWLVLAISLPVVEIVIGFFNLFEAAASIRMSV